MTWQPAVERKSKLHERRKGERFSLYASAELGQRIRSFCWQHRLTFNEMAIEAIAEFMSRYRGRPSRPKLPPGPRLKRER